MGREPYAAKVATPGGVYVGAQVPAKPRKPAAPPSSRSPGTLAPHGTALVAPPPLAVMVVEDDVDVRETLCEVLADEGYRTEPFAGGRQALDHLTATPAPPGLILLDLMMPTMDGWTFRAEQKRRPELPRVPTVILSADGNVDANMHTLDADGYLRKPIHIKTLLQLVERFCGPPSGPE